MEKAFWLLRKVVNIITVLGTWAFVGFNFDIIACCFSWYSIGPTMSIYVRYHSFLEKIYGWEKALDLKYEIIEWTLDMIEKGVNKKLCIIISIMMVISMLLGIKDNGKANKRLRVYYIAFLIFMLIITFWGPSHYRLYITD